MHTTLLLLDVDGVLNPDETFSAEDQRVRLDIGVARTDLVRELAGYADIAWASTWAVASLLDLGRRIGLAEQTFASCTPPGDGATPKLLPITRWLARQRRSGDAAWSRVIWIDDSLRADAREWAAGYDQPVLLLVPEPPVGLTPDHVHAVAEFSHT